MFFIDKKEVVINTDFSSIEWKALTKEFYTSIQSQIIGSKNLVIGHALTPLQSAKFTNLNKINLLKETFIHSPALSESSVWEIKEFAGRKILSIERKIFKELLHKYCGGNTAASSDIIGKRTRSQSYMDQKDTKKSKNQGLLD